MVNERVRVPFDRAQNGDILAAGGGLEYRVAPLTDGRVLRLSTLEGEPVGDITVSWLERLGLQLYRSARQLPRGVGAVVRREAGYASSTWVRCQVGEPAWADVNRRGVQEYSRTLESSTFTILSEGVAVE